MTYVQAFQCANCGNTCEWSTRAAIPFDDNVEVKTIGSMYCNATACIAAEADIHGLPVQVVHWIGGRKGGQEDLVAINERMRGLLVIAMSWWSRRRRYQGPVEEVEREDYNVCLSAAKGGPVDVTADRARAEMMRAREKVEELEGLLEVERKISLERLAELEKERKKYVDGTFWKNRTESAWAALNAIADRLGVVHEDDKIKAAVFEKLDELADARRAAQDAADEGDTRGVDA